jgi:hypothetical protein
MDALETANHIRRLRAQDKVKIKARELDARELLQSPPEYWESAHIADVLRALPGVGRTKVTRILQNEQVSPSRTLQGLTDAQVSRIAGAIERYCPKAV